MGLAFYCLPQHIHTTYYPETVTYGSCPAGAETGLPILREVM